MNGFANGSGHDFLQATGFMFDCDGTLIDTLGAWEAAERDLFAQTGPLTDEQEDEIHSAPIVRAAEIFHEYGACASAQEVLDHLDSHLLPFYRDKSQALPGAVEFARAVVGRGIPCVVLSSSPRRYLEAGLRHVGLLDCFVELVSTEDVGCSKQDSAIYEHALNVMGSKRESTWAVDDAPYAIAVMRDFGLSTIAVGNGCTPDRATLLRERATVYVDELGDLLA